MLGLGVFIGIAKKAYTQFDSLFGALKARSTYYENDGKSRSDVSRISSAGILDKATILLTPTATSDALVHSVKTYTGDELITNGDFSNWTGDNPDNYLVLNEDANNYVTESNGQLRMVSDDSATIAIRPQPTTMLSTDNTYRISVDLTFTTGTLNISGVEFNTSGTKVFYLTPPSTYLQLAKGSALDVLIDNLSVIDVSSDFDFDRASSATRINSDGLVQDMQSITDPELVLNGDFEELGDNVLIGDNSTFDSGVGNWTTYTNGIIAHDADKLEVTLVSGGGARINTNSLFTGGQAGKTLKIRARIWQGTTTRSNIAIYVGSVQETVNISSTPTYFEVYLKPTSTGYLTIYSSSDNGTFFIDDISVQQVDPNDRWSTETGWSIEDGKLKGLNVGEDLYAFQTVTALENTGLHKVEYTISGYGRGSVRVGLGTGLVNEGTKNQADGTYTEYIQFSNGLGDKFVGFEAFENFTGSIDNVSVKHVTFEEDNVDLARINYDSNGENGHILLEPTSTNLVGYSLPNNTNWSKGINTTITENYAVSPDGTQNASRFVMPTGSGTYAYYQFTATSTADHTLSFYAKNNGGDADVTMAFFAPSGAKDITLTNEWQRFEFTRPVTSGNAVQVGVDNITSVDMLIYGVQCEALSYATSYIPSLTGSTVTRATEKLTGSGNSTLINSREGVLYAEIAGLVDDDSTSNSYHRIISISDNSTTNRVELKALNDGTLEFRFDSSSSDIRLYHTSFDFTIFNKIALVWESGRCAAYLNGVKVVEDLTFSTFSSNVLHELSFDSPYDGGSNLFYGKCKALAVFNEALSDTELGNLTNNS